MIFGVMAFFSFRDGISITVRTGSCAVYFQAWILDMGTQLTGHYSELLIEVGRHQTKKT
jgi:hypothetical protein